MTTPTTERKDNWQHAMEQNDPSALRHLLTPIAIGDNNKGDLVTYLPSYIGAMPEVGILRSFVDRGVYVVFQCNNDWKHAMDTDKYPAVLCAYQDLFRGWHMDWRVFTRNYSALANCIRIISEDTQHTIASPICPTPDMLTVVDKANSQAEKLATLGDNAVADYCIGDSAINQATTDSNDLADLSTFLDEVHDGKFTSIFYV